MPKQTLTERVAVVETDVDNIKKDKTELWKQLNALKDKVNRTDVRILSGIVLIFAAVEGIKAVVS